MKLTHRVRLTVTFYFWIFLILAALIFFKAFELQSSFINQTLLEFFAIPKSSVRTLEWHIVLGICTFVSFLPSIFFMRSKIKTTPTLVALTISAIITATVGLLVFQKILIPFLYVMIAVGIGTFGAIILKMIVTSSESEFLRLAFSQFVSEKMLKELLTDPDKLKLAGKEADITVLFLDIRGFTTFSEKNPPVMVVARLNSLLDKVTHIILAHDGTLDKYIGDAVMALWGAPNTDRKQAQKAVGAALAIQSALEKETGFSVGIGINYGPAIIGNMGSSKRFDYTAIGDTVNTAARLESATKELGVPIIISQSVVSKLKNEGNKQKYSSLGEIKLKGKAEKIAIYTPTVVTPYQFHK